MKNMGQDWSGPNSLGLSAIACLDHGVLCGYLWGGVCQRTCQVFYKDVYYMDRLNLSASISWDCVMYSTKMFIIWTALIWVPLSPRPWRAACASLIRGVPWTVPCILQRCLFYGLSLPECLYLLDHGVLRAHLWGEVCHRLCQVFYTDVYSMDCPNLSFLYLLDHGVLHAHLWGEVCTWQCQVFYKDVCSMDCHNLSAFISLDHGVLHAHLDDSCATDCAKYSSKMLLYRLS